MTNDSDAENQHEDEEVHCPVCREHTMSDNLQSQGLILSGMKALFESDEPTITNIFNVLTPYDGHTAIGLAAAFLHDLCLMIGAEPKQWLDAYREGLNHAQATAD